MLREIRLYFLLWLTIATIHITICAPVKRSGDDSSEHAGLKRQKSILSMWGAHSQHGEGHASSSTSHPHHHHPHQLDDAPHHGEHHTSHAHHHGGHGTHLFSASHDAHEATQAHLGQKPNIHLEELNGKSAPHHTFRGRIHAHNPHERMDHTMLEHYAQHAYNHIKANHPESVGTHMSVSAVHAPGEGSVRFHTQPNGESLKNIGNAAKEHPQMGESMLRHGLKGDSVHNPRTHENHFRPLPHSEQGALLHALGNKPADVSHNIRPLHYSVGSFGHFGGKNKEGHPIHPCRKCQGVLNDLGVSHKGLGHGHGITDIFD